jgi:hypothetical protein
MYAHETRRHTQTHTQAACSERRNARTCDTRPCPRRPHKHIYTNMSTTILRQPTTHLRHAAVVLAKQQRDGRQRVPRRARVAHEQHTHKEVHDVLQRCGGQRHLRRAARQRPNRVTRNKRRGQAAAGTSWCRHTDVVNSHSDMRAAGGADGLTAPHSALAMTATSCGTGGTRDHEGRTLATAVPHMCSSRQQPQRHHHHHHHHIHPCTAPRPAPRAESRGSAGGAPQWPRRPRQRGRRRRSAHQRGPPPQRACAPAPRSMPRGPPPETCAWMSQRVESGTSRATPPGPSRT